MEIQIEAVTTGLAETVLDVTTRPATHMDTISVLDTQRVMERIAKTSVATSTGYILQYQANAHTYQDGHSDCVRQLGKICRISK